MRYIRSKILKFIKLVTNRGVWKLMPFRSAGDLSISGTAGGIHGNLQVGTTSAGNCQLALALKDVQY